MALTSTSNRVTATGNGTTTVFNYNKLLYDASHLQVYKDATLQATGYTVGGVPGTSTSVTFTVAPANGVVVLLLRVVPLTQLSVYAVAGAFPAATTEKNFDLAIMAAQQFDDTTVRVVRQPVSDVTSISALPTAANRALRLLTFDAAGDVGVTTQNYVADLATVAGIAANVTTVAGIAPNVTTVAGIAANVTTVAGSITNVNATGGSIANVNTVAGAIVNVNTVATNIANVNLVGADIANVNATGASIANVNAVGSDLLEPTSEINTVAVDIANVNSVGSNIANVNIVGGIGANVTTVAGISANVTTVAGVAANVTTVAGNITSVNTCATNIAAIIAAPAQASAAATSATNAATSATNAASSAATAVSNANASAASAASAAAAKAAAEAALDEFTDTYLGPKVSDPTLDNDGGALTAGDWYFNTTSNISRIYNGSSWSDLTVSSSTVVAKTGTTGSAVLPAGTTGQRDGSPSAGYLRFNSTSTEFEGYNGTAWASVGGSTISNDTATSSNRYPLFAGATSGTATTVYTSNANLLYKPSTGELKSQVLNAGNGIVVNNATVGTSYTIASGENGMSVGPITISGGVVVTVSSGQRWFVL